MLPDHWPGPTWGSPLAVTRRGSVAVLQVRLKIFLWSHSHQLKFLLRSTPHSHQLIENANLPLIFTSWPPAERWQRTRTRCTTGACLNRGPAWRNMGKVLKRKLPGLLWVFYLQKLHAKPLHSSDHPFWKMTWILFVWVWGSPREVASRAAVSLVLGPHIKTSFDKELWSYGPRFVSFVLYTARYVLAWASCDLR